MTSGLRESLGKVVAKGRKQGVKEVMPQGLIHSGKGVAIWHACTVYRLPECTTILLTQNTWFLNNEVQDER